MRRNSFAGGSGLGARGHCPQFFVIACMALIAGCRTAAQKTHVPRVDLQLSGAGNRGYLIGTPPPPAEQKATREMLGVTIEVPSFYKAKKGAAAPSLPEVEPLTSGESAFDAEPALEAEPAPEAAPQRREGKSVFKK